MLISWADVFYGYLIFFLSASKFAVRGLTSALSEELARAGKTGVKTTTVYPSFVDTGLTWYVRLRSVSTYKLPYSSDYAHGADRGWEFFLK